jgi:hypothetical protein
MCRKTEEKAWKNLSQGSIANIYEFPAYHHNTTSHFFLTSCSCFVMFATMAAKSHCGNLVAANDVMAAVKNFKV